MFSYVAYGLGIQSDFAIPEFVEAEDGCDVTIQVVRDRIISEYVSDAAMEHPWALKLSREEAIAYLKTIGVFQVEAGERIVIIPEPGASEAMIRFCLVGNVMAMVLYQRGLLVLHASVVDIGGEAVAFLGVSGEGKSSTAAAFLASGYPVLTDDVAPVTSNSTIPTILPGFPQIKLSRAVADVLGYDFESLILLHPDEEKRGYRFQWPAPAKPLPIRCIYTLAYGAEFSIASLSPQDSIMELVQHSRPTTLMHSGGAPHLRQCAAIARQYPIYRLNRPKDVTRLSELVLQVTHHLTTIPSCLTIPSKF
ncbi:MAG: hypothetical protein VKL39_04225 [Leptolyngbyaceae bacterium]|nr:hypothetical protein [Leptolyngbyaceae bacterium]